MLPSFEPTTSPAMCFNDVRERVVALGLIDKYWLRKFIDAELSKCAAQKGLESHVDKLKHANVAHRACVL